MAWHKKTRTLVTPLDQLNIALSEFTQARDEIPQLGTTSHFQVGLAAVRCAKDRLEEEKGGGK